MLLLSAPPTFTFENDARRMNGRYREAASQRSTIKPMAGLGRVLTAVSPSDLKNWHRRISASGVLLPSPARSSVSGQDTLAP
tara:strand:- start:97 stop:342 length:246 start_codon:yes stop_codon:yes gene_type:complete